MNEEGRRAQGNHDPGPMHTKEVVENLIAAVALGLICGAYHTSLRGIPEGGQVAGIMTLFFVACAGVHWAAVNVAWEYRAWKRKTYI